MPEIALEPAEGLRIAWESVDAEAVTGSEPGSLWRLDGSLAPGYAALRVLTASVDGAVLVLVSARPADGVGHDSESAAALLVEDGGEATNYDEILVSTQYDGAGSVRRVGLELYGEDEDYPSRGAGDATAAGRRDGHDFARLEFRFDGRRGSALYEIVHA